MKLAELDRGLKVFAASLLAPLTEKPVLKYEVIRTRPVTVTLGLRASGVSREAVRDAIHSASFRDAHLAAWPVDVHLGMDPAKVGFSADGKQVLIDLVFFGQQLETADHLQRA